MIANTQSGPYSWWESSSAPPGHATAWAGIHPASGQGAAPHAWGMANANMALLDAVATQQSNGDLIVGRGVPARWLAAGHPFGLTNFPGLDGQRLGLRISATATSLTLTMSGAPESGAILLEVPGLTHNVKSASVGTVDEATGVVQVPGSARTVTVKLDHRIG